MWFNNFIGWIFKHLYKAEYLANYLDAKVYTVKKFFPKWAGGQTFGKYIFVRENYSQNTIRHEYVHVQQYKKFNIFFFPCYATASIYAVIKYGRNNYYYKNWFEKQAREKS